MDRQHQRSDTGGPIVPVALSIAGSDSGGGAGVQADLRTFSALRVFGTSALTAVTAQNTLGVRAVLAMPAALVRAQIDAVLDDFTVGAIKTGMLATAEIVDVVVGVFSARNPTTHIPVVVDPVMIAKGGAALLDDDAVAMVRARLLPFSTLVTPNLPEAERLLGFAIHTVADQQRAAHALVQLGARAALVKGGHSDNDPRDVLFDGTRFVTLTSKRIDTPHTHGTGCTFAAAITALLARGVELVDAVTAAHAYVRGAIEHAPQLGHGHGPLHHMHPWYAFDATKDAR